MESSNPSLSSYLFVSLALIAVFKSFLYVYEKQNESRNLLAQFAIKYIYQTKFEEPQDEFSFSAVLFIFMIEHLEYVFTLFVVIKAAQEWLS